MGRHLPAVRQTTTKENGGPVKSYAELQAAGIPIALYRLYDVHDVLLYLGVSAKPAARLKWHRPESPWGRNINRQTVIWYDGFKEAEAAETIAIAVERPLYNFAKSPYRILILNGTLTQVTKARYEDLDL